MAQRTPPPAAELIAAREASTPTQPPVLPQQWTAQVLLTPFGDMNAPLTNYSQLIVANVEYDATLSAMRVSVYLTEDLSYMDFFFFGDAWWWAVSTPGGPPTDLYGPFDTPLRTPAPDFLAGMGAKYGNTWPIMGVNTDGWVIPTNSSSPPDHGSWYSMRQDNGYPFRIFTFDNDNPCLIPILGSYYLANIPTFTPGVSSTLHDLVQKARSGEGVTASDYVNPLLTQRDVQSAMANPLASAPCTAEQIQALIPGFVAKPSGTLPVWADQQFILAMTIGTDFIPYYTLVFYWWTGGKQQSVFIGLGLEAGQGTYNDRQDTCLFTDGEYTDTPQYVASQSGWQAVCCGPRIPNVGVPRPDWVEATNGQIMASIAGNADFGLGPNEQLNLIACPFQRGAGEEALFWVWFKQDQTGVLFTEANFVNSVDHNLQLIDYVYFERDASWIDDSSFSDPCPLTPCPDSAKTARAAGVERRLVPHGM